MSLSGTWNSAVALSRQIQPAEVVRASDKEASWVSPFLEVFQAQPAVGRPSGRPRTHWKDCICHFAKPAAKTSPSWFSRRQKDVWMNSEPTDEQHTTSNDSLMTNYLNVLFTVSVIITYSSLLWLLCQIVSLQLSVASPWVVTESHFKSPFTFHPWFSSSSLDFWFGDQYLRISYSIQLD